MRRRTLALTVFFFGWLWSGWMYLKGHAPFGIWDDTRISAIAEG